jgi:hypothetical protein
MKQLKHFFVLQISIKNCLFIALDLLILFWFMIYEISPSLFCSTTQVSVTAKVLELDLKNINLIISKIEQI